MNIAFDAKRAYQNSTGLGNYSRTLISSLATYFPQHNYYLYAPRTTGMYVTDAYPNIQPVLPDTQWHRWFSGAWRSKYVVRQLQANNIDIYHGLSHEIPFGIHRTGVKSVVTMHDLIYERYPAQYNPIDVHTYRRKAKYACHFADSVIAISEQTRRDIIHYYKTPADKITVVYQGCNELFDLRHSESRIGEMKQQYHLPSSYFLYVGAIIERKNLLSIVQALVQLKGKLDLPLVVLGDGKSYKKKVKEYAKGAAIEDRIIWMNEAGRIASADVPLLYQGAEALLYPSMFEGFGLPILEALQSGLPVITTIGSCFEETGGDAALYVDTSRPGEIAAAMQKVVSDTSFAAGMTERGLAHAQLFNRERCATGVMHVYENL